MCYKVTARARKCETIKLNRVLKINYPSETPTRNLQTRGSTLGGAFAEPSRGSLAAESITCVLTFLGGTFAAPEHPSSSSFEIQVADCSVRVLVRGSGCPWGRSGCSWSRSACSGGRSAPSRNLRACRLSPPTWASPSTRWRHRACRSVVLGVLGSTSGRPSPFSAATRPPTSRAPP